MPIFSSSSSIIFKSSIVSTGIFKLPLLIACLLPNEGVRRLEFRIKSVSKSWFLMTSNLTIETSF